MKKSRIVMTIAIILTASLLLCGCMQHGHFEFEIEEFKDVELNEYAISTELDKYKILGVVIRPGIKDLQDNCKLAVYGYTSLLDEDIKLCIDSVYLYTSSGEMLISISDYNKTITRMEEKYGACFREEKVGSFSKDIETIKSYETLYCKINVGIIKGDESEFRELTYEFNVVEYLTTTLPMPT